MFYAFIDSKNKLSGFSSGSMTITDEYGSTDVLNIEVSEEIYNNAKQYGSNYYIYSNGKIVLNPNYEQEQAEKEAERIGNLTMTALDFIGVLEHYGLDYATQIKPFLESQPDLDKQLKYCQNVYCKVARSVMPITIKDVTGDITITAEMVERAFRIKNGEDV